MACSKLFSGDLPEISIYIIQNLRNNYRTLYSLTLVNRFWCRLAIPLLWEDPFSVGYQENTFHFLDTYLLLYDNENELKEILNFHHFDSNLRKPLFNYPSLIKTLNLTRMQIHIVNWFNSSSSYNNNNNTLTSSLPLADHLHTELNEEHSIYIDSEKMEIIFTILLKLFVENDASLNNLYITIMDIYSSDQLFCDVLCNVILNNPKFISEIELFSFNNWDLPIQSLQTILSSLLSLSTSIKHIDIFTNLSVELKNLGDLIQSQSKLSSIKTRSLEVSLLDSLKYSSNTLTSIHFYLCRFSNAIRFDALSHLTQLESLQFRNCDGLDSNVIQPLLNINTPLKIKTFVIIQHGIKEIIPLLLLIQKISDHLENLVLSVYNDALREILFNTIIDFCKRIKFLNLKNISSKNIPQLSKMIFNFGNHLKYLTLETSGNGLRISSVILKELSKSLPISLNYLDLHFAINPEDLQVFFENCNQIKLQKLLIRNKCRNNLDVTFNIIKNFVKENDLEFLAYGIDSYLPNNERHEKLEKLFEETQTFIKMMRYDDLVINVSEIDGSLIIR